MRNEALVNRIMENIYSEFRYRWCEADACACMGCVNRSEINVQKKMQVSPITKEEWQRWVESHELITIKYEGQEYSFTAREWVQAIKNQ